MSTTQDTVTTQAPAKNAITLGYFGNGRFSHAMSELYADTVRLLNFTDEQAHATARRFGVDAGQLDNGDVKVKLGKSVNKDGLRAMTGAISKVKVNTTWALDIATVCIQLDEARKNGLIVNDCTMNETTMDAVSRATLRLQEEMSK